MTLFSGTHLKNEELTLIYRYLKDEITRDELATKLGRTRTNTYYYLGRAVAYWLKIGVLRFKRIKDHSQLGGREL